MVVDGHGTMNLTQLRYFVAVARARNLSRAATELRIAQPAVTRQLKLLEAELETPLFTRHHRGVDLTEAGRVLLERAEGQIRSFDQLKSDVRDASFAPSGHLRIGSPPALIRQLMAEPSRQFLARYPKTTVEIRENISDQLIRAVLTESLDLAVASTLTPQPHLFVEPLFNEQIWLFGPRKAVLGRPVSMKFISGLPLLMPRRQNATRDLVQRRLAEAGLSVNLVLETDSTSLMEELVENGAGYVTAPYFSHRESLRAGKVSGAPIKGLAIRRALLRRKDRPLTRAMQVFVDLLQPEILRLKKIAQSAGKFG
jgi:LysR family transcriptional regulator, nitrogen assimilation regulatory protein